MRITAKSQIWLSNPTKALSLDLENGQTLIEQVTLHHYGSKGEAPFSMEPAGWIHIGEAELILTITKRPEEIALASVRALQDKLAEKDAEHEKLRNGILEAIGKFQALTYEAPKGKS